MALVPQHVSLFAGSVMENIRCVLLLYWIIMSHVISYGKPDATKEEIIEAAKKANAHEFIERFPDGYDTDVCDCIFACFSPLILDVGRRERHTALWGPKAEISDRKSSPLQPQDPHPRRGYLEPWCVGSSD